MVDENQNIDPQNVPPNMAPKVVEPEVVDVTDTPQFKEYEAMKAASAAPDESAEKRMLDENPALKMQGNVTVPPPEAPVAPAGPVTPPSTEPKAEPTIPAVPVQPAKVMHNKKGHIIGILLGLIAILTILSIGFSVFLVLPAGAEFLASIGYGPATAYVLIMMVLGLVATLGFVGLIMGTFKLFTAKKEDKKTKKKGFTLTLVSTLAFFVTVIGFVIALVNFNGLGGPAQPANIADLIITNPVELRNLTAPIEVTFDASQIPYDATKFEAISYQWDFVDGDRATGPEVTHTFNRKPDNGVYNVQLTILYRNLVSGEQIEQNIVKPVAIANQQALVSFTMDPDFGGAPITVTFDASESEDLDGDIVAYEWDFDGDGVIDGDGRIIEHKFDENGTYDVTLTITDTNGEVTSVTEELALLEAGGFEIVYTTTPADKQLRPNIGYQFDASESVAPEGKIVAYNWSFGDNTDEQQGQKITHSYRTEGIYALTLTVTTDSDQTQSKEFQVQVGDLDASPQAVITTIPALSGGALSGTAPLAVSFSANNSKDPNNDIVDYSWDFNGDGVTDKFGANAEYTYEDAGEYRVVLTVVDADGNKDTAEAVVKASERGAQARLSASPVAGEAPLSVLLDASATTTDPGDPIVTFEWNFGDGTPLKRDNAQLTYIYKDLGTYIAEVTAITASGKRSQAQITINVNPTSLKACYRMSRKSGPAPLTVEFSAKCSRGVVSSYKWSFGDGSESIERQPVHTFDQSGSFAVTLTVEKDNVVDIFTDTVEVR